MKINIIESDEVIGYVEWTGENELVHTVPDAIWNNWVKNGIRPRRWNKDRGRIEVEEPVFPKDQLAFLNALPYAYRDSYYFKAVKV